MIILERKTEKLNKYKRITNEFFSANDFLPTSLLSLYQWQEIKKQGIKKNFQLAIEINSDESSESIKDSLKKFSMIQLNFKTFKDGRPFTLVKELRIEHKFKGEIRASGHILPDQYVFLLRCGFDTVEIKKEDKEIWIELLNLDNGLYYQP